MGRRKMNTEQLTMRIDVDLLRKLKSINPALLTTAPNSTQLKFRHGALGKYVARLIRADITEREKFRQTNILEEFKDERHSIEKQFGLPHDPDAESIPATHDEQVPASTYKNCSICGEKIKPGVSSCSNCGCGLYS